MRNVWILVGAVGVIVGAFVVSKIMQKAGSDLFIGKQQTQFFFRIKTKTWTKLKDGVTPEELQKVLRENYDAGVRGTSLRIQWEDGGVLRAIKGPQDDANGSFKDVTPVPGMVHNTQGVTADTVTQLDSVLCRFESGGPCPSPISTLTGAPTPIPTP